MQASKDVVKNSFVLNFGKSGKKTFQGFRCRVLRLISIKFEQSQ